MAKNDLFNDMSIDSILNDVKRMTGEESAPEKIWSLDEIDALLADDEPIQAKSDAAPAAEEPKTVEKPNIPDSVKAEKPAKEEKAAVPEKAENEPSGLGLKEFAMKNAIESEAAKSHLDEENIEDILEEFEEKEDEPEIEPLIVPATEEEGEEYEEPDESEEVLEKNEKEIPGQISIEKTRVFNEVEARAVRDESITHHIGENKIIRTGSSAKKGGMETDPYRERFLNKPKIDIEKTQDHRELLKDLPAKTIEKHGVVVKKPTLEKTSTDGLSPVPILVDAADEYDAQQKLEMETQAGALKSNSLNEDENQIVLDGFNEQDEVEIVNEEEEEAKLRKIRRDKASKFRLFPNIEIDDGDAYSEAPAQEDEEEYADEKTKAVVLPEEEMQEDGENGEYETQEETPTREKRKRRKPQEVSVAREFFGPKDAKAVYDIYMKERSYGKRKIIVGALALALLIACAAMTSFTGNFSLFSDSPFVYSAANLIVLIAVGAVNYKPIADCIEQLKNRRFNRNSALTASLLIGILQCAVSLGFGDLVLSGTHIYAAVALFPVLLINIGDYIKTKNDIENFILINREQKNAHAVKKIDDDTVAFEVGRGLMIKDPDIRYDAKVNFPYKFVEMSQRVDPTADVFNVLVPAAFIAGIIVGIISAVINRNAFVGVTSFTGVFLMAMPAASVVSCASLLKNVNKRLNAENGMVSGYEAVEDALDANAAVLDARDIFSGGDAKIYGLKLFNSMRIDEAILYTAAVVIQSGGALTDVFDSIILSKREMLPNVESLAYEERLGCSGWIYNYRVLVGNRDLLLKHNVEVQSKEEESVFTRSGRQVVYLAVEGKVAAMFVVGYSADEQTAVYMRELEKAGVSILVRTTDSNISEELVEQYFGLPRNFIKVISPVAGLMYKEMSEKQAINEPCRILHNGKVNSFLKAFTSALKLQERRKMINILQYIGVGISVVLMAMFSFLSGLSQAGAVQILLFETLWTLIVAFVPQIKKI